MRPISRVCLLSRAAFAPHCCAGPSPVLARDCCPADIPLKVRDRILAKHHAISETAAPTSELSMQVYAQETARKHAAGEASGIASFVPPAAHAELQRLARRAPNYSRNKAKLCFHYMKGTCTRGAACPYRHEFPDDWESNKEFYTKDVSQSIKDRFFGTNDQVANKWIAKMDEDEERAKSAATSAGSTLVVLGMVPEVGPEDLKDALGGFGDISRAEAVPAKGVAFVEFASKDAATEAMQSTKGRLAIDGHRLRLKWSTAGRGKSEGGLLGDVPGLAGGAAAAGGGTGSAGAGAGAAAGGAPAVVPMAGRRAGEPAAGYPAAGPGARAGWAAGPGPHPHWGAPRPGFPPPAGYAAGWAAAGAAPYGGPHQHHGHHHLHHGHPGMMSTASLPAPAGLAGGPGQWQQQRPAAGPPGRGRGGGPAAVPYASMHPQRFGSAPKAPVADAAAAKPGP